MDYDVLILGGGIIGCSVAYELSKYSLNIALIEKDYDIADDVALINAAVVYDGTECENTLLSRLESMGK
jgi:L-2-hydroxyglutarate oxidase LhgO